MLADAHATAEGYLRSPQHGTLADLVATTLQLEKEADIAPSRRLGVPLEWRLLAQQAGDRAAWGSPWVESQPRGPHGWWPVESVGAELLEAMRSLNLEWLCLGSSSGDASSSLIELARSKGLQVAARPSPGLLDAIETRGVEELTIESLPLLLEVLISRTQGRAPNEEISPALRHLATVHPQEVERSVAWIVEHHVTVVPLMTSAWRQASMRAIANAPNLNDAAKVLPFHSRIAGLSSPGAMRMGGREASRHLGVPQLDRAGERDVRAGLDVCERALQQLFGAGTPVLAGSGAPGVGLAPGLAAREEMELFAELGAPSGPATDNLGEMHV